MKKIFIITFLILLICMMSLSIQIFALETNSSNSEIYVLDNWEFRWGNLSEDKNGITNFSEKSLNGLQWEKTKKLFFKNINKESKIWFRTKIISNKLDQSLFIENVFEGYEIYLNNKIIDKFGRSDQQKKFSGFKWSIIDLPENFNNKYLYIKIISDCDVIGMSSEIKLSSKNNFAEIIFKRELLFLLINSLVFFMGIFLFTIYFFVNRVKIYLAFFIYSISISFYCICHSQIKQLVIFDNPVIWLLISNISLFIVLISIIIFFLEIAVFKNKFLSKLLQLFWRVIFIILVISIFSLARDISSFYFFQKLIYILFLLFLIVMIYASFSTLFRKTKEIKIFLSGIIFLSIFTFLEIMRTPFHKHLNVGPSLIKWIYLFHLCLIIILVLQYMKFQKQYKEMEFKVLQGRMNPHFMFNSLSIIHSLIKKNTKEANVLINKLAENYKYLLDYSYKSKINFNSELEFVQNYLEVQKYHSKEELEIRIDSKGNFKNVKIPPLTIQPIVENSIKHGLQDISGKAEITINVSRKLNSVLIEVSDNGIGLDDKSVSFSSLENIKKRLSYYFQNVYLDIQNIKTGGTKTSVSFDLED